MPFTPRISREDVDGLAAWAVIRAARELARRLATELAPLHLSPVEFGVLAQLAAADGLSQADLARAVGVRPQSMTVVIAGLTDRGLVERRAEPGRGRHSRLTLTDDGGALLGEAWTVAAASDDWFGDDPQRTASLAEFLHPLLTRDDTTG
ncbi:MarR family winged helix-turn-helix transcriptional regulator [Microbacterium invictum]|uniref:MarR family transcriptional regulator n=1 Tax=Microbacterium invictum TaxID=515415 RepID=A0ABZ0VAP3_9MICO|nr:MarR family transcriptional regulator [Microbacterium invictum]WQB70544.1 MarR family transcriptional regulator [Microbacterium invictum]